MQDERSWETIHAPAAPGTRPWAHEPPASLTLRPLAFYASVFLAGIVAGFLFTRGLRLLPWLIVLGASIATFVRLMIVEQTAAHALHRVKEQEDRLPPRRAREPPS